MLGKVLQVGDLHEAFPIRQQQSKSKCGVVHVHGPAPDQAPLDLCLDLNDMTKSALCAESAARLMLSQELPTAELHAFHAPLTAVM